MPNYFLTTIETPSTPTGRPALLEATTLYAELAKSGLLVDDETCRQAARLVELGQRVHGLEFYETIRGAEFEYRLACTNCGSSAVNLPELTAHTAACGGCGAKFGSVADINAMGAWLSHEAQRRPAWSGISKRSRHERRKAAVVGRRGR